MELGGFNPTLQESGPHGLGTRLESHLVHTHSDALWEVPLCVLQKDVCSSACDLLHLGQ